LSRKRKYFDSAYSEDTERVHARISTYGAETGRVTTKDPNLQGLDRDGGWRSCIADPSEEGGCSILSADLDQIELRILARVTGDPDMIAIYRDGSEDLHSTTVRVAMGIEKVEKKSRERTIAKRINFGRAYGSSAYGMFKTLTGEGYDISLEEVEDFFDAFDSRFPDAAEWQESYGYDYSFVTESLQGRKRLVSPVLYGERTGLPNREERLNGPIQSTGADILKLILIRLSDTEPHYARLLVPVHDEVIVEADPGHDEEASAWVTETMTAVVRDVLGDNLARDVVEVSVGESWG
jgi:DNA polymerase I